MNVFQHVPLFSGNHKKKVVVRLRSATGCRYSVTVALQNLDRIRHIQR